MWRMMNLIPQSKLDLSSVYNFQFAEEALNKTILRRQQAKI